MNLRVVGIYILREYIRAQISGICPRKGRRQTHPYVVGEVKLRAELAYLDEQILLANVTLHRDSIIQSLAAAQKERYKQFRQF